MSRLGVTIHLQLWLRSAKPFTYNTHSCAFRLIRHTFVIDMNKTWHLRQPVITHHALIYNNFMGRRQHGYCFNIDIDIDDYDENRLNSYESRRRIYDRGTVIMLYSERSESKGAKISLKIRSPIPVAVLTPELQYLCSFSVKYYQREINMSITRDLVNYSYSGCYSCDTVAHLNHESYSMFTGATKVAISKANQYQDLLALLL